MKSFLKNKNIGLNSIERIIKDAGFARLKKRSYKEMGITNKNKIIPQRSETINIETLKPFKVDCPSCGIFFFIPYIIESGIIDIVKKCNLPESEAINSINASLSFLLLKLLGNERLSHMDSYDQEPGFGVFAGLNILPKNTYMNTYSCLTSEKMLLKFQREVIVQFKKIFPDLYGGEYINLDFHSIPHYGDNETMEKIWCGAKNKTMKGANTIFASDSQNNTILYTRGDILRKEESSEIKNFVSYWKSINHEVTETLVFDCKFTKYEILDELASDGIKFITLRKRSKSLLDKILRIPDNEWVKVNLKIKKRKHKNISVHENTVRLKNCKNNFRQIIIKDHGRLNPTVIITTDENLSLEKIIEVYAKRWHIENKLSELVSFFNLNALSSPLMIRIHFDILWTMIADTFYRRLSKDLRRYELLTSKTIFRKFINIPGQIEYNGEQFILKIRKRAYTPIIKGIEKLSNPFEIPWLENKKFKIIWTP